MPKYTWNKGRIIYFFLLKKLKRLHETAGVTAMKGSRTYYERNQYDGKEKPILSTSIEIYAFLVFVVNKINTKIHKPFLKKEMTLKLQISIVFYKT